MRNLIQLWTLLQIFMTRDLWNMGVLYSSCAMVFISFSVMSKLNSTTLPSTKRPQKRPQWIFKIAINAQIEVWRVSTHQPLTSKNRVAGFSYLVPQICTSTWDTTTYNYYTRFEWKKTKCCDGPSDKVHSRIGWALSHGGIWANAFGCQNTRELSSPILFQVTLSMVGRGKNNW